MRNPVRYRARNVMKETIPGILSQPVRLRTWDVKLGRFTFSVFLYDRMPPIPEAFRDNEDYFTRIQKSLKESAERLSESKEV